MKLIRLNMVKHCRGGLFVACCLICLHAVGLIGQTTAVGLGLDPSNIAEVARQKDVVWLSLVTAIVAMLFCAWLVRQILQQQMQAIKAIDGLREEWARRPCAMNQGVRRSNEE